MFQVSWEKAFTERNIESAWHATGIFPYNPNKILAIISPQPNTPPSKQIVPSKTPHSARAMRHTQ